MFVTLQLASAGKSTASVPVSSYLPPASGMPGFCLYTPDSQKTPAIRGGVIKPEYYQFALVGQRGVRGGLRVGGIPLCAVVLSICSDFWVTLRREGWAGGGWRGGNGDGPV